MMFDVPLFLLVSVSAVGAITFAVPGQVRGLVGRRNDITVPIHLVMAGAAIQQSLIAVGLAAAGTAAAPRSGLGAPWFEAVSSGYGLGWREMVLQLPAALAVGGASSVVFLVLYYRVFRPRMVAGDAQRIEEFRTSMGPMGRVLMGGVAEEVMFRWGVMSVLAWISIVALGLPEGLGMWLAIVVAGLLF